MLFRTYNNLENHIIYNKLLDISIDSKIYELINHIKYTVWCSISTTKQDTTIYYCDTDFRQIPHSCTSMVYDMREFYESYLRHEYGNDITIDSVPF